jgi:predicted membrane protein
MRRSQPNSFAIVLIVMGVLILIGKFTPLLGSLFGVIFSLLLIALGYYGIRRGNSFFGWIILFFGIVSLLSKLAWLIVPLLGIGLIVYGISALSNGRRNY